MAENLQSRLTEAITAQAQGVSNEVVGWFSYRTVYLENWKWLVYFGLLILGLTLQTSLEKVLLKAKNATIINRKKENFWFYFIAEKIEHSLSWILICIAWTIAVDMLTLPSPLEKYSLLIIKVFLGYQAIGFLYLAANSAGGVFERLAKKSENSIDSQLAHFATKTLKVTVIVIGGLVIVQNLGVNVTSVLAGLGIGGLALALAAQDTAANFFGSITIIFDSPFRIGDWVKIGDVEGTIEEVGFRSTRVRTFYNSLITIPNSIVAKEKIDNMGLRSLRRIHQNLGLTYDTPPDQIDSFCENVKYVIMQDEKVVKETIVVAFNGYTDSTLNILVNFHLATSDGADELQRQQRIFCEILKLATQMKVQFAFPTQTVFYQNPVTK